MGLSQKAKNLLTGIGSSPPPLSVELRNFKAFGSEGSGRIPIKPITLVFGQNSAGKSSLLHSLLWLDHGVHTGEWDVHHPRLAGDMVDLGGFQRFVHRHESERTISISLEVDSWIGKMQVTLGFGTVSEDDEDEEEERAEFSNQKELSRSKITSLRADIKLPDESIGLRSYEISQEGKTLIRFNRKKGFMVLSVLAITHQMVVELTKSRGFPFDPESHSIEDFDRSVSKIVEETPIRISGKLLLNIGTQNAPSLRYRMERTGQKASPLDESLHQAIMILTRIVGRQFSGIGGRDSMSTVYLGPLRIYPDRDLAMVTETDRSDWLASGLFAWEMLREIPEARTRVNRILKNILELRYEFQIAQRSLTPEEANRVVDEEIARVMSQGLDLGDSEQITDTLAQLSDTISKQMQGFASENDSGYLRLIDFKSGTPLAAKDVGMGISQVIPVLVAASILRNKIICMEQPELHLHPGLQTKLADSLLVSAIEQGNSLVIETHSEHLILRLLRRIRETNNQDFSDWPKELKAACPYGIRPEDIAVIYVEPGGEGSKVTELPITPDGDFSCAWPDGFFAERSKELF